MDTEAFLLERQGLVRELEEHRAAVLDMRTAQKKSFLGLPWADLSQIVFSLGKNAGLTTWLPRILLTTAVPILLAAAERKMESLMRRKSGMSKLLSFLPLSRFGL